MMGGGGGDRETTQTSTPWGPQGKVLRDIYGEARSIYDRGEMAQLAPQSPYTQMAREGMADWAMGGGSGNIDQALDLAGNTLQGDFLSQSNPYLQDAIAYAQQPVIDAWNEQIKPGIDATFAGTAGGMGSGAFANAVNQGSDALARNLAGAATQAGYQNYGDERSRQMRTLGLAPGLEGAAYGNLQQLANVGAMEDAYAQAGMDLPFSGLQRYAGIIQGMPSFGTTTGVEQGGGTNPFLQVLGLGMTGAGLAGGLGWRPFGP